MSSMWDARDIMTLGSADSSQIDVKRVSPAEHTALCLLSEWLLNCLMRSIVYI